MAVSAAFMVPHPPIIVPEIGRGEEKKSQKQLMLTKRQHVRLAV